MSTETTTPDDATHYFKGDKKWKAHYIKVLDDGDTRCWAVFHGEWMWMSAVLHAKIRDCVALVVEEVT